MSEVSSLNSVNPGINQPLYPPAGVSGQGFRQLIAQLPPADGNWGQAAEILKDTKYVKNDQLTAEGQTRLQAIQQQLQDSYSVEIPPELAAQRLLADTLNSQYATKPSPAVFDQAQQAEALFDTMMAPLHLQQQLQSRLDELNINEAELMAGSYTTEGGPTLPLSTLVEAAGDDPIARLTLLNNAAAQRLEQQAAQTRPQANVTAAPALTPEQQLTAVNTFLEAVPPAIQERWNKGLQASELTLQDYLLQQVSTGIELKQQTVDADIAQMPAVKPVEIREPTALYKREQYIINNTGKPAFDILFLSFDKSRDSDAYHVRFEDADGNELGGFQTYWHKSTLAELSGTIYMDPAGNVMPSYSQYMTNNRGVFITSLVPMLTLENGTEVKLPDFLQQKNDQGELKVSQIRVSSGSSTFFKLPSNADATEFAAVIEHIETLSDQTAIRAHLQNLSPQQASLAILRTGDYWTGLDNLQHGEVDTYLATQTNAPANKLSEYSSASPQFSATPVSATPVRIDFENIDGIGPPSYTDRPRPRMDVETNTHNDLTILRDGAIPVWTPPDNNRPHMGFEIDGGVTTLRDGATPVFTSSTPSPRADYSNRRLTSTDIQMGGWELLIANFSDTHIEGVDFSGQRLDGASFNRARLTNVNLNNIHAEFAFFLDAEIIEGRISSAYLHGVYMNNANLSSAQIIDSNLKYADLTGTNLQNANLNQSNLSQATLTHSNLSGADLSGVNLSGANLINANFTDANITGANFSAATINEQAVNTHPQLRQMIRAQGGHIVTDTPEYLTPSSFSQPEPGTSAYFRFSDAEFNSVNLSTAAFSNANSSYVNWGDVSGISFNPSGAMISGQPLNTFTDAEETTADDNPATDSTPSGQTEPGANPGLGHSPDLPDIDGPDTQNNAQLNQQNHSGIADVTFNSTPRPFNIPDGLIDNNGAQSNHGDKGNNNGGAITAVADDAPEPPFRITNGKVDVDGILLRELDLSGHQPGESIFGMPVGLGELPELPETTGRSAAETEIPVTDTRSETQAAPQQEGGVSWGGKLGNDKGQTAKELGLSPTGELPGPTHNKAPEPIPGFGQGVNSKDVQQPNTRDWGDGVEPPDLSHTAAEGFPEQDSVIEDAVNPEGPGGPRFRFPGGSEDIPPGEFQTIVNALPALQQINLAQYSQLSPTDQQNILTRVAEYQALPANLKAGTTLLQYVDSTQTNQTLRQQMLGEQQRQIAHSSQQLLNGALSGLQQSTIKLINSRIKVLQNNTLAIKQNTQALAQSNTRKEQALASPKANPAVAAFIKTDHKPNQAPPVSSSPAPTSEVATPVTTAATAIPRFMVIRTEHGSRLMENLPNGQTQMLPFLIPGNTPITREGENGVWYNVPDAYAIGAKNLLDTLFLQGAVKMLNNGKAVQMPTIENTAPLPAGIPQPAL